MPNIAYIILALVGFGFIIFIHELGHFLAAKLFRVKVKAFSLGFPPTVLHKQIGETDYRLGIIPMGGYVSMVGEDPTEAAPDDPRALNNIARWKRAVVFLAGVFMNMVSAVVILMIASGVGLQVDSPIVGGTAFPSPARSAGLQPGDRITHIDGRVVDSFNDVRGEIIMGAIRDPQHRFELTVLGRKEPIRVAATNESGMPAIGVIPAGQPVLAEIEADSAAAQAGLREGDRILAINGEPVSYSAQCGEMLNPTPKEPFTIEVQRTLLVPAPAPPADDKDALPPDEPKEGDLVVSIDDVTMNSQADALATLALRSKTDAKQPSKVTIRRTLIIDPATLKEPDYGFDPQVHIKEIVKNSAAEAAGMKVGDVFRKIARIDYPSLYEIMKAVQDSRGAPLALEVWRDGKNVSLTVPPKFDDLRGYYLLGITFDIPDAPTIRRLGDPDSATLAAGIPEGSRIVSIDDTKTGDWLHVSRQLAKAKGKPIEVAYTAPDSSEIQQVTVTPRLVTPEAFLTSVVEKAVTETMAPMNPTQALAFSLKKVDQMVRLQYYSVVGIINKQVPSKEVGGPFRIGAGLYQTAEKGWSRYVTLVALISMAIAMLNIMPIPPLDGGHVMFLCVEGIIRRPVPLRVRSVVSAIGLVALLSLVLFAFWNDGWWFFRTYIQ